MHEHLHHETDVEVQEALILAPSAHAGDALWPASPSTPQPTPARLRAAAAPAPLPPPYVALPWSTLGETL